MAKKWLGPSGFGSYSASKNIFLVLLILSMPFEGQQNVGSVSNHVDGVLKSLQKVLEFYSRNVEKVNLDSVFGIRVGQGALNKAITESKLDKDNSVFTKLTDLHSEIVNIAERGFNQIKSSDSDYFHKFKHLIDAKWFAMMPYHSVDKSLFHKVTLHDDDSFDEQSSDQCMTDLLGSQLEGVQQKCIVTDKCWNLMTKKGPDGYFLTHQGLFLLLAENRGCRKQMLQRVGDDEQWQHQIRYLGANVYLQMMKTFNENLFSDEQIGKDLFAEQIIVCQMLGVVECFDVKLLEVILKLQDNSGCWKQKDQDKSNEEEEARDARGVETIPGAADELKGNPSHENEQDSQVVVKLNGRRLQEEVVLKDGCSAHFTGVATGCLGMFAYWFASHPDIMLKDMASSQQVSDETAKNAKAGYIQYLPKDDDILDRVFLVTRWLVVFVLISISFYYLRKWRRKSLSVLRKRRKLSI